eukprot:m51a1_g7555 putative peroxisomal PEX11 (233) ;mRNA; r:107038-108293
MSALPTMNCSNVNLANAVKFLSGVKNRDAAFRFIQFANRIVLHSLAETPANSVFRGHLAAATGAMVGGRKLMSFGHEVGEAWNVVRLLSEKEEITTPKLLMIVRSLAMFNFFTYDHIVFLSKYAGVIKADPHWNAVVGARSWLVAVLISLYLDAAAINRSLTALQLREGTEAQLAEERRRLAEVGVRQVRNTCDLVVACSSAEVLKVNNGLVSVCGAISAALFIYEFWPSNN